MSNDYLSAELLLANRTLPKRYFELQGAINFRDVGGYRAANGSSVVWRRLFRSSHLSTLTDLDVSDLNNLRIQSVIDIRTIAEQQISPDRVLPNVTHYSIPIAASVEAASLPADTSFASFLRSVTHGVVPAYDTHLSPAHRAELLSAVYRRARSQRVEHYWDLLMNASPAIGEVILILADRASCPAVIHCNAGKDRTGLLFGLLLLALDIHDDEVWADYALSNDLWGRRELERLLIEQLHAQPVPRLPGDTYLRLVELCGVIPETLSLAIDRIRATYGSVASYLSAEAGISDRDAKRLHHFLERREDSR